MGWNQTAVLTSPGTPRRVVDLSAVPVCARHGEPAVRRVDWRPQWRPLRPGEREVGGALISSPIGYTGRVVERMTQTVAVDARGWPLCAACTRTRSRWVGGCLVTLTVGVLCVVGAAVVGLTAGGRPVLAVPIMVGIVLVIASTVPLARGSLERITGARGTADPTRVLIDGADARFQAAVGG